MNYKYYREIQPERSIEENFSIGQINYRFKVCGNESWIPAKSYLLMDVKLTNGNNSVVNQLQGYSFNMCPCDNVFQQMYMKYNGKKVSEINDYVAPIAALKKRLYKSKTRINSSNGDLEYTNTYLENRQLQLVNAGNKVLNGSVLLGGLTGLGFNAADTYSITQAGLITFTANDAANAPIPDLRTLFAVGDVVIFAQDNTPSALTIQDINTAADPQQLITAGSEVNPAIANLAITDANFRLLRKGKQSLNTADTQIVWRPPLGFFDIQEELCGDFHMELTPHSINQWQKYIIESYINKTVGNAANNYKVTINSVNLYIYTKVNPSPLSGSITCKFPEISVSSQAILTSSLTSLIYHLKDKNFMISWGAQDQAAGDDTQLSRSKLKIRRNQEQNLVRWYVKYQGVVIPSPIPSAEISNAKNKLLNHYKQYLAFNDASDLLSEHESMREWLDAGMVFNYCIKKGKGISNELHIYTQYSKDFKSFDANISSITPNLLLFDHSMEGFTVNCSGGEASSISVL